MEKKSESLLARLRKFRRQMVMVKVRVPGKIRCLIKMADDQDDGYYSDI